MSGTRTDLLRRAHQRRHGDLPARSRSPHYIDQLNGLLVEHHAATQSPLAERILREFDRELANFWQVVPKEMLERLEVPVGQRRRRCGRRLRPREGTRPVPSRTHPLAILSLRQRPHHRSPRRDALPPSAACGGGGLGLGALQPVSVPAFEFLSRCRIKAAADPGAASSPRVQTGRPVADDVDARRRCPASSATSQQLAHLGLRLRPLAHEVVAGPRPPRRTYPRTAPPARSAGCARP